MDVELKTIDERGRLVLGKNFAGKVAQVERLGECEFRLVFVQMVPESEMWLYRNQEAKALVFRGLAEARDRKFSKHPPDLKADKKLVTELED
jgi:hypothetical protein